jgi:hypothetical protein
MKTRNLIHHIILMTVCLVGTLSAYAQGIVVTMNDGTEQRFSEETIQEMFLSGYDGIDLSKGFTIKVNGEEIFFSAEELAKVSVYGYEPVNIKETPAEAIDLGLPSGRKWASYNVGATEPEGYGSYFAWGELFDKDTYEWSNYKYCNGHRYSLTKYVDRSSYGRMDGQRVLLPEDDVAQQRWGGGWRTPTHEDQLELISNCEKTAEEVNGVKGTRFTGPNGNSIFLPKSGYAALNQWTLHRDGYYWSSTITYRTPAQTLVDDYSAWIVQMYGSNTSTAYSSMERCYGLPIRPVRDDLSIAQKDTNMTVGSVLVFPVMTGSKHYAASSSDPSIATATVEGCNVTVTAISSGEVIITVSDTEYDQSVTLNIIVNGANQGNAPEDAGPLDLGLPSGTRWATMNVGAKAPEEYGVYYSWGETFEKDQYGWEQYTHCDGSRSTCKSLGDNISGTEYDAAHVVWGGQWCMPTAEQVKELFDQCQRKHEQRNGVYGTVFTGPNGNSIFMPFSGYRGEYGNGGVASMPGDFWSDGFIWTSTPASNTTAYSLKFGAMGDGNTKNTNDRNEALPIRAVVNR